MTGRETVLAVVEAALVVLTLAVIFAAAAALVPLVAIFAALPLAFGAGALAGRRVRRFEESQKTPPYYTFHW